MAATLRFGIIGLGNMGGAHCAYFHKVDGAVLAAVCDVDPARRDAAATKYSVPAFENHRALIDSGICDAILIATPHYDHHPIALDAFDAGKHVLVEKPITVSIGKARDMVKAAEAHPHCAFGIMFQLRTSPIYQKLRSLIADGELGELTRVSWIVTDWFRSNAYYASGGWRATWAGEGGGVLINQCPHNLDLIQWITGMMPNRVTAIGTVGKTHPIEVEDEISAILEYPNGAVGHFVTSTGEFPGTNRLEICGTRGKVVSENGRLVFHRTRKDVAEFNRTTPEHFPSIETWTIDVPYDRKREVSHQAVTQNFVDHLRRGDKLLAPGVEGVRGLELGNAIQMSGLTRQSVDLPVDAAAYDDFLSDCVKRFGGRKTLETQAGVAADFKVATA